MLMAGSLTFTFAISATEFADAFSAAAVDSISDGLDDFSKELGFSIPQAAVQQNVYAEAFIGKIFPAVPPHFAVGIDAGLTHLNTSGLAKAADKLRISGVKDDLYLPVFNADIRIGGVIFPFDVGFLIPVRIRF